MISSIGSSNAMRPPMQQPVQSMTDEQKTAASEILANYDSTSMTDAEHESLRAEFEEAGITPSKELGSIMEGAGFEIPSGPGGPQGAKGSGKPKPPEFSKLMEKLESSDVSEEEIQSYIQTLQNEKGEFSGALMDDYA